MPDPIELTPEEELDDAFNEFAGDSESIDNGEQAERLRDDQGRFASNDPDDDLEEEELPIAAESDEAVSNEYQQPDYQAQLAQARSEAQQWQHRFNSDAGRQTALQRKIEEQNQLIAQLQSSSKSTVSDNPEGSGVSDAEWEAMKDDFPEIAQAVESRINASSGKYQDQIQKQQQTIERLQQQFQPIQEQAQTQYREAQFNILEQKHPDWRDVSSTNEFKSWVGNQPTAIQQLLESENAADAAYLIDTYKLTTAPPQGQSDELRQRRKRQLSSSQSIPSRGVRKTAVAENDLDAAFDYYADRA